MVNVNVINMVDIINMKNLNFTPRPKNKNKIVILDASTASVVILENVPGQETIDKHHDSSWEDWLYELAEQRNDIPDLSDCNWQWIANDNSIETIKL